MSGAAVSVQLTIASAPIERTGRRAGDPPGKSRTFAFATARAGDDPLIWRIFGFSATSRLALSKLKLGDVVTIKGRLAIKVTDGAAIAAIDCVSTRSPKPKAPRQSGRRGGTRRATADGVAKANAAWMAKHGMRAS